ncbi:MAG: hypothetical protein JJ926_08200 [Roseitalea sp.]|uniref:hypothetical protein n=1 Tax=Oceaniradius stylonematis TaxID=2184161 RepID=UPI001B0068D5|nr:hypothetical protein [Oceaniradius stylonematis]MBO6551772.1 hypothetical protein [Roseitalea sp.]MBO6951848.1 hypothetical protein [Rhizobiaceae bacterium]MBO6592306.1 hypothetical protein [Roseitalea sp.]MBO6598561.1 hypothetical protein [Roseitalea sp.]MBO6611007.1 hypothetical protein [Roseitalea sp.]
MSRATHAAASPVLRYFSSIGAALDGLDVFLRDDNSPLYQHELVARTVVPYLARLAASFDSWRNRLDFSDKFRISRADSGFPVYQNVLELEKDRRSAESRLDAIPDPETLRADMADFILRHKAFPKELQDRLAERLYLETIRDGSFFTPFVLPETIKVSVNPKTGRPFYVTHWGVFDGSATLPMIYSVVVEDSTPDMVQTLVGKDGKLNRDVDIPLPVGGLLNPALARAFDQWAEANSAFSLTPATVAANMDEQFETLHPKQLRRIVLGPFYSAGITQNNDTVSAILDEVGEAENAWLLSWTIQDIYSKHERPGRKGLWSSSPPREEFHIETADLEAARMGVSSFEKHALIPHEAYQALYAAGQTDAVFAGYKTHIVSGGHVISDV